MKKSENMRLMILVGVLVVVAGYYLVRTLRTGAMANDQVRAESLNWEPHELPELGSSGVDPVAVGERNERNPFLFGPPPTPTPDLRPKPTPAPVPTRRPAPPRPTPTPTPPGWKPPPPFTMEYLGTFGPAGRRVAVFRKKGEGGADIKVGLEGGVFEDDFIIRSIDLESVVIGYVGFPEKEMKRVPLAED